MFRTMRFGHRRPRDGVSRHRGGRRGRADGNAGRAGGGGEAAVERGRNAVFRGLTFRGGRKEKSPPVFGGLFVKEAGAAPGFFCFPRFPTHCAGLERYAHRIRSRRNDGGRGDTCVSSIGGAVCYGAHRPAGRIAVIHGCIQLRHELALNALGTHVVRSCHSGNWGDPTLDADAAAIRVCRWIGS